MNGLCFDAFLVLFSGAPFLFCVRVLDTPLSDRRPFRISSSVVGDVRIMLLALVSGFFLFVHDWSGL